MCLLAPILNYSVFCLFNLERPRIGDMHCCECHKQEKSEAVLFVLRKLFTVIQRCEGLKLFFCEIYHVRLGGRESVTLKGIAFCFSGTDRSIKVHTDYTHVFVDCAGIVMVNVAEMCCINP